MNITTALALLVGGALLFWATMVGTRLARPPRWTSDTMVMCFITPAIVFLIVSSIGMLAYLIGSGVWRRIDVGDATGIAAVLGVAAVLGTLLARWSRRAPRATATVIAFQQPQTPDPLRPAPQVSTPRKAA